MYSRGSAVLLACCNQVNQLRYRAVIQAHTVNERVEIQNQTVWQVTPVLLPTYLAISFRLRKRRERCHQLELQHRSLSSPVKSMRPGRTSGGSFSLNCSFHGWGNQKLGFQDLSESRVHISPVLGPAARACSGNSVVFPVCHEVLVHKHTSHMSWPQMSYTWCDPEALQFTQSCLLRLHFITIESCNVYIESSRESSQVLLKLTIASHTLTGIICTNSSTWANEV
jgi:hypothetical protein